jgi:hypothetical protein
MPAYNFQNQFAEPVELGIKRKTIRGKRKRPTVIGDKLYLYQGMRTSKCRLLLEAVCTNISDVRIVRCSWGVEVWINLERLGDTAFEQLWQSDGFKSAIDFEAFFLLKRTSKSKNRKDVWTGEMIEW